MSLLNGGDGETLVVIASETTYDPDGNPIRHPEGGSIHHCVVEPAGQATIDDRDVVSGDTTTLRVLAPAGTVVEEGARVRYRGDEYTVKFEPFDYSIGRRPVLARHHPRTLFLIERIRA